MSMEFQATLTKKNIEIRNNDYYDQLGTKWYRAHDEPVAIHRAEANFRNPWIASRIQEFFSYRAKKPRILDVGCGAGFLSNHLAREGFDVTAVDLSVSCLQVAKQRDETKTVKYMVADAYHLPFEAGSFDIVTCTDLLEHVSNPQVILNEVSRVLAMNGFFFFHTYNRNWLSWMMVSLFNRWFATRPTGKLHAYNLFIKPNDFSDWLGDHRLALIEMHGIRPRFFQVPMMKLLFRGRMDPRFRFKWTAMKLLSYAGIARKVQSPIY